MSKDEFLRLLERKLEVINEKERRDIIDEYRTHIEMKMQEGKSEEEAIEDFGDIDELVDDILDAYKINTDRVHHSFDTKLNRFMDDLFNGFQRLLGSFTSLQMDDVVRLVFEILVILILLAVLHIPFRIISSLGSSLLHSVAGFGIGSFLAAVWKCIIGIVYVAIFVIVLVNLCSKRLYRYRRHPHGAEASSVFEDFKDSFDFEQAKETVHAFANGKGSTHQETIYDESDDIHAQKNAREHPYEEERSWEASHQQRYNREYEEQSFQNGVSNVAGLLMRIFFCLLMIPFVGILIGLCCALGVMIVLSCEGVTLFGIYFIISGGLIITCSFLTLLYRVLWRRG